MRRPALATLAALARLPTLETLRAVFPQDTQASGTVRVLLACRVQQGGSVSDCRVEREEPAGKGYGAADLKVTPEVRLDTWTVEGFPTVGGVVKIPIRFELGAPAAPAPKPAG
ncbi:hypothetical protein [Phenylobacterium sp.]|jgi:protein TonB|uniref:hypothetical protein n=1 Tax=Phenylobacterium sp. TaxID=1871053 RepID=UPI002F95B4B5